MLDKLKGLRDRFDELNNLLSQADVVQNQAQYRELSRESAGLQEIVAVYDIHLAASQQLAENRALAADSSEDAEIRDMAREEIGQLEEKIRGLEDQLKILLLPKDPDDERDTIIEIRAGTGGDEAALFGRDLYRMYCRYAEVKGWRYEVINSHETDIGGFKEMVLSIQGQGVFSRLKYEGGVHRVQRVPKTETQGRVHTSAATVAVMPEADEVEININPGDLRIDVFRSSGPGGQSVNTTDSAVRITHIPTGLVVICQNEKSQLKNKNSALKVLRSRLYEKEQEARDGEAAEIRRKMVGSGDRSERIRTYNFPQGRITDHRINLTIYQLEQVLMGELDSIIEPLITHHQAELLKGAH